MLNYAKNKKRNSLSVLSEQWLIYHKNSFKPNTFQKYKYHIDKYIIKSSIANKTIKEISSMDLSLFSENLVKLKLSNNTVNDILLVLGGIIKYAHDFYNYRMITVPFVKENRKEMRVLSKDEQLKLEQYIMNNMDECKLGVQLALYTGIRIGELCALQWKDISNGNINIHKTMYRIKKNKKTVVTISSPKTVSSFRIIPIPMFLNSKIEKMRKNNELYILGNERTPIVEPRLMQIRFKKITTLLGLNDVTFHTLRHTFATRCVECGFDLKSLSEILGHSDVKTTLNKYVHSSMEQKKSNMDKLQRIFL